MSRWKGLPAELDPRVRHLVVRLRRLKDHSGLSMRQLAAKTGYSASSWERYLGGRSLPPREAVEAIAAITGEDPTRLLALRDVAAAAWSGGQTQGTTRPAADEQQSAHDQPVPQDPVPQGLGPVEPVPQGLGPDEPVPQGPAPDDPAPHARPLRVMLAAGVVALVLVGASATVLVARLTGDEGHTARTSAAASASAPGAEAPARSAPSYTCRVERVDGRWYAGHSRTRDAILWTGHSGPKVAEAQCLLRRAGFSPGDIDGIYGPLTERAVKRLQKKANLVVDGIVGPHTWGALRG
ncbi:peptidoglycan-binding protein [Streptomyces sp. 15-116A]|uniref:peptidoglycan-binding protein n=1 Tax=Streptomyces sp. 15-116A TaxID=2259035 RepID=UPI0021B3949F|nr:peptidoglycan-binding protein [Streptomyces sp. 15-116A]MCT7353335.1 peptidoglycan-binding protein [Streptomyces sp. 15-116A]